jgi:hypothetical protein
MHASITAPGSWRFRNGIPTATVELDGEAPLAFPGKERWQGEAFRERSRSGKREQREGDGGRRQ